MVENFSQPLSLPVLQPTVSAFMSWSDFATETPCWISIGTGLNPYECISTLLLLRFTGGIDMICNFLRGYK